MFNTDKLTVNCSGVANDGGKFVVPCVLVQEQVLNGGLLTIDQITKSLAAWAGKPVVISHPNDPAGNYKSAIDPQVYETQLIGFVFNPRIEDKKLLGDLHLDEKMICKAGHCELNERLKAGEVIEVSTGYMCEVQKIPGMFGDVPYDEIQENIEPDHLAVLVDEIGACSIADGCGTNRANKSIKHNNKGAVMCKEKVQALAKQLRTNEKLTPEQFDVIMAMDEEQAAIAATLMQASADAAKVAPVEPPKTEEPTVMSEDKVEEIVANRMAAFIERQPLVNALIANAGMTHEELSSVSTATLKKLCANAIAPDFSGANGFGQSTGQEIVVNSNTAPVPVGIVQRKA